MASLKTRTSAPPAFEIALHPRLIDATSAPSVVASGIQNEPFAYSPFTTRGPAVPSGI